MRTSVRLIASTLASAAFVLAASPGAHAWSTWEMNYGGSAGMQLSDCANSAEIIVNYGKGCFRETGDWFIVRDTALDEADPGVKWHHATSDRRGICRGNGGFNPPGPVGPADRSCNKNLLEQTKVTYRLVRNKPTPQNPPDNAHSWVDDSTPKTVLNDHG